MGYLLLALLGLGVLTALIALVTSRKGEDDKIVIGEQDCAICDGTDSRCEMTCRLEAAVNPIEYFDDEELDAFRGRQADSYTDAEMDMFREVLYTMQPQEVKAWCRSLDLRGVALPEPLRDEVLLFMEE